jgi:anaerobic magnesium-protoporphyrin IX monomethyl ester cyclase
MTIIRTVIGNKTFVIQKAPVAADVSPIAHSDCPHVQMLGAVESLSRGRAQKNLSAVVIHPTTRTKRVAMVMTPFWSVDIAPYNIARLTALAKQAGFATCAYDLNVEAYHELGEELWSPYTDWKWDKEEPYWSQVHPVIEPVLLRHIDRIVEFAPDVVGFSLYYTNNNCANWVVERLRERLPEAVFLAGGSQAIQEKVKRPELYDHIVVGEGEMIFLDILEKVEAGEPITEHILRHPKEQRIDLDSMPWPDYSDLPLDLYRLGTSVGSEMSRGCVAKCQFCSETTFWRYRGRLAGNIVDEIEYQYHTFGVRTVWFIDSLVNGNLGELRAFARGVVEKGLVDLHWVGYCRNDGRMDLEYFQDLKASGCDMLNFGVESGSQRVLDIMKKNVKREAVEQNLYDITTADISAFTNWFVGFPGEERQDFADTMTLMWRTRRTNIAGYAVQTCNVLPDTPLSQSREKFGISHGHFGALWTTEDYTNTAAHRLVRLKSVNILMNHMRRHADHIKYPQRIERPGVENHYSLAYNPGNTRDVIPYETDFDYNIIKTTINPVADTLVNEIWPLLRVLWLAVGEFELDLRFDHDQDLAEFGPVRVFHEGARYNATHWFKIDKHGDWHAKFEYNLEARGPNGYADVNGFHYGFRLGWEKRDNWARPTS